MTPNPLRPRALRPGDPVAVLSPSGPPKPEQVRRGVALLEGWGLRVRVSPRAFDVHGYLAGDDETRLAELNAALRDPAVRGIFCARGGYGLSRMVDRVDFAAAASDPKIVVGYSDITALFCGLYVHSGVTSVHGPVVITFGKDGLDPVVGDSLRAAVMTTEPVVLTPDAAEPSAALTRGDAPVTGRLLGGNLSLLVDAVGTPTCPDYRGAIVFCEEINEEPYRVDRILTQLRRSGTLDGIAGIALGQFTSCGDDDWDWGVVDTLRDRLADLDVPVLGGIPIGHGDNPRTIPFGTTATLDPVARVLTAAAAVS